MGRLEKVLGRLLRGTSDQNISFRDLCWLLEKLGFGERIRGDHHIFSHPQIEEVINVQPKGSKAKAYQVRQVREILTRYRLADDEADGGSDPTAGELNPGTLDDNDNETNSSAL